MQPRTQPSRRPRRTARGVSLIEALIALAVMGFGLLAVVGIQTQMRVNADVAKQRSEATRIAQEAIEAWRSFSVMAANGALTDWADIATPGADVAVAGYTTNTAYTLARTVAQTPGEPYKRLLVSVTWNDRTGTQQQVQLISGVAGVDPALSAALVAPSSGLPNQRVRGRNAAIPPGARDLGEGKSGFMPPQGTGGTVAFLFDNTTALLRVCVTTATDTAGLTLANITGCSTTPAQLLSGFVRFASTATPPTAAEAENPSARGLRLDVAVTVTSHTATAQCFDDAPATRSATPTPGVVTYYCAIPAQASLKWSGRARIVPQDFGDTAFFEWTIAPSGADNFKVCRYTTLATDTGANVQSPLTYNLAEGALVNQNFLVILADHTCPTDVAPNPAAGDFVNSNTRLHQDGSSAYPNPPDPL